MRNFIPKEFRFSHKFAFLIHDLLAQNISLGEEAKIFDTLIEFDSPETPKKIQNMNQAELWEWLTQNDQDSHYIIIYKQIFIALLSDFCHFVYEGLKCSEKGKLTVSYALFRKPFKDNLLIFEWLLANPSDFMDKFYNEDVEKFSPQKLTPDQKKEIIQKAIDKTSSKPFDAQFIHDLRYNRSSNFSLSGSWDKANHLVTNFEKIKTEKQNLNFVFSNEEFQYSQWFGIYFVVPILLYHSFNIIESLFATFAQRDESIKDVAFDQCKAGFILWDDSLKTLHGTTSKVKQMNLIGNCDKCHQDVSMSGKKFLTQIFNDGFAVCKNCQHKIYLDDV